MLMPMSLLQEQRKKELTAKDTIIPIWMYYTPLCRLRQIKRLRGVGNPCNPLSQILVFVARVKRGTIEILLLLIS